MRLEICNFLLNRRKPQNVQKLGHRLIVNILSYSLMVVVEGMGALDCFD